MATGLSCSDGKFVHKDRCCEGCPKGKRVQSPCEVSKSTVCQGCEHGYFMDGLNFLPNCRPCKSCHSNSHMMLAGECKADRDRQCKCEEGYYCEDPSCGHCRPVSECPRGSGVSIASNGRTDTICEQCPEGKYNNVSDSKTPCLAHTKCEAFGKQTGTPGTNLSDVVCTEGKGCHWVVPAGLWAGLILTVLLIGFGYYFRRKKHRSKKKVFSLEPPVNDVVLNLPNLIPAEYNQPCDGKSDALCCNGQHCDSDMPSTVMASPCPVEVHHPTAGEDLECDGPGMPTLTASAHFNQSAARTGQMTNFSFSPCQSQPQEDEWSGT
ncbi:hypothetical protein COCON_G00004490 [Conger conger]|uniref:TNFR-Cys domain-containing protein n=1 Tax=Conger conger TaxID=82655 RepID=A0A9Q1I8F0_CONCO|nr:tumor necrosis factor receptor superfamily member 5 [Conger conger]KAJ8287790.1 hypothetical protein COCON_G00004490 [Conger conger]